jgi:glycosyltransferase involved in cell wall biosynthesis
MSNDLIADARRPCRLAFVITELEPGGAERCLVELATRIDRALFSPVVYSLGPLPSEERRSLVARLEEARVPTHFLSLTRLTQYFGAAGRLAALLREQDAQVVQTFLFHGNVIGAQAARAAGASHLVTGLRVADPRWWRIAAERFITGRAERHVCVSQSVAEYYRRRGFAAEKLAVIPNGVDLVRWRDAAARNLVELGVPPGRRVLLFVGRLDKQKGLDRFFYELPAIFRELPDHDLVLVGNGPQRAGLERCAQRLKMRRRVHFLGWQADVAPIVAAVELLVLPSRWEGMPNAVLEAMAAGKPVVSTQAEGAVELLGLAALDQTAPVGDWQEFRSRVVQIGRDQALAQDLGHRNQARAEQFSLEAVVARYQRLYQALFQPV